MISDYLGVAVELHIGNLGSKRDLLTEELPANPLKIRSSTVKLDVRGVAKTAEALHRSIPPLVGQSTLLERNVQPQA